MKKFKNNFALIATITLPLLIIVLFCLVTLLPKYVVAPPRYNFLFATGYNSLSNAGIKFAVTNGRLNAEYIYDPACSIQTCMNKPALYIFDVKAKKAREIKVIYPTLTASSAGFVVHINMSQFNNVIIDTSDVAPDGYQYRNSSGNFFLNLFYHDPALQPLISKQGNNIVILPDDTRYGYYDMKFIGWIIPQ